MASQPQAPDIRSNRLSDDEVSENFSDLHPPLTRSEALIEADRCYFCYDAPCTTACPTGIDIPNFIQKIRSDNIRGSAHTIFSENIFGGMCARVCPTEVLCEEACVRNTHEKKPVEIGLLQRHATDAILEANEQLFTRAATSGKKIAVVGGGPAGLSCAHRLAMLGHQVVVFNRNAKPGGLNEYGIAAYKTVDEFAQAEVEYVLGIGGIEIKNNCTLGVDIGLTALQDEYDAVFLAAGLASSNNLGIDGENKSGVINAIEYIADLRQADNKSALPVGRHVVVVGGGMTAVDVAVQSKRLGAERVDMVYRRGPEQMGASVFEQALAQTSGVTLHHWAQPESILGDEHVTAIEFACTEMGSNGKLTTTGEKLVLEADVVFKAIGQQLERNGIDEISFEHGRIVVDERQKTSVKGIWAGGDCVVGGEDLTVSAVQHGKIAAISIDEHLQVASNG